MKLMLQGLLLIVLFWTQTLAEVLTSSNLKLNLNKSEVLSNAKHHQLVKRALATTEMTAEQQQNTVDAHNNHRQGEGASDMRYMIWNNDLADMAQEWANGCLFEHGQPSENPSSYTDLGQNLYISTATNFDEVAAVLAWFNEKSDYTYDTGACSAVCGHYTQVVWSKSFEVGCGVKQCTTATDNSGNSWSDAWNFVCNYGPAGNLVGAKPFQKGDACTKCSTGTFYCYDNKFCREKTECDSSGVSCACNGDAACTNCATVASDCSCTCADGYSGITCSDPCDDFDSNCGANPGWPASWCTDATKAYVAESCPKLCGSCNEATGGTTCDEDTGGSGNSGTTTGGGGSGGGENNGDSGACRIESSSCSITRIIMILLGTIIVIL